MKDFLGRNATVEKIVVVCFLKDVYAAYLQALDFSGPIV
jgi:hypothetical protein